MNIFDDFYGYRRLAKKWHSLIMGVKSDEDDSSMFLVYVSKKYIEVTNGKNAMRIHREVEYEIDQGLYILTKDRIMVPVNEDACELPINFPKMDSIFKKNSYTKTAKFDIGLRPLVAMSHAMNEFGCTVDIDSHHKTFEAIAKLMPDFGRIYGFKKTTKATKNMLHLEFLCHTVVFEYLVMSKELDKSDYLTVDTDPCLFDIEKPEPPKEEAA